MDRLRLFHRRNKTVSQTTDTWHSYADAPVQGRVLRQPAVGQWQAAPFEMSPPPEHGAVGRRIEQLTDSLRDAIDEGTGKSLDLLIASWTGEWLATVDSEYHEHCAQIDRRRGEAKERLAEATATAGDEQDKHEQVKSDHGASRSRLSGAQGAQGVRQDWAEPHLVAGRSWFLLVVGAVLIVIGALADIIAFHNVLELVLRTESAQVAWIMAGGATSMALVVAASLGVASAIRHRGRYLAPRHRPARLPVLLPAAVWIGLGAAMFLIRWQDSSGGSGGAPYDIGSGQSNVWQALFFLGIYLISGVCTIFEAQRLYNPEYMAFTRLGKARGRQAKLAAKAAARQERAQVELDRLDEDLRREDGKRDAAIAQRKALGAAAANYARVRMAAIMRDPAKTGITETGPGPDLAVPLTAWPAPVTGP